MRLFSVIYCGLAALAIAQGGAEFAWCASEETPPFNVEQWLQDRHRKDFPWKIEITRRHLTLQLRYQVEVKATINGGRLPHNPIQQDLYFVLKVASADGHWHAGYSCNRFSVPPDLDGDYRIENFSGAYLRPGTYTLALMVYDPVLRKGNIWRQRIKLPQLKENRLQGYARNLQDIEFVSLKAPEIRSRNCLWPLAKGREWLPVKNKRPLHIDILVNASINSYIYERSRSGNSVYQHPSMAFTDQVPPSNYSDILGIASTLSHLALQNGFIRVSLVDASQGKTFFFREEATSFDWLHVSEMLAKQDLFTIDTNHLRIEPKAAAFLLDQLTRIIESAPKASESESPLKIVIVISRAEYFQNQAHIPQLILHNPDSVRLVYFRLQQQTTPKDAIARMLDGASPELSPIFLFNDFQTRLVKLLLYLEQYR
jgi:hypothetical protein